MKALIATDVVELQQTLSTAVAELGFQPMVIADPGTSWAHVGGEASALVLATWNLSGFDGLALCRRLRQEDLRNQALVVLVTGPVEVHDLEQALAAGADDWLSLPMSPELLRLRLRIAGWRVRDRAARLGIEHQLRESIERFELAVQGANDGLWDAQPMGEPWHQPDTEIWFSQRCKELLGFTDEEFPNVLESWEQRLHPDDYNRVMQALVNHIDHRQPYDVEYRLKTKPGEYRWFSARGQAQWDEHNRLMRMSGSLRDITQTKEYEAKLEQSEAAWRSLVENAPDIIILAKPDGTIEFINQGTPSSHDAIGRKVYDFIPPAYWDTVRTAFDGVCTTGRPQRYEIQGASAVGTGWYSSRLGPIWRDGKVSSVVLIATDITQRKVAEEEVRRERQSLQRLLDLQERDRQLTAYEIHDGLVQYLAGGLMHLESATAAAKGMPAGAKQELDRALSLLRDAVVEGRRVISGLRPPILDERGVVDSLEYLVNEARQYLPAVTLFTHAHFGRLAAPLEAAIFRITQEALSNTRQHSGAQRAAVELIQHGEWIRLLVRDWGCGFDPAHTPEQRFGLQGMRQRARLLGTDVTIESAPERGTIVVVDFPLISEDSSASPNPSTPSVHSP